MNTCATNVYEEEIDLIDLFWNLLEKWKLMVVFAVIGAVLVGGLMTVKDHKAYQDKLAPYVDTTVSDEKKIEQLYEITSTEREMVELLSTTTNRNKVTMSMLNDQLTVEKSLTANQKKYYNAIIEEAGSVEKAREKALADVISEPAPGLSLKFILVGFVLGAFGVCAVVGLKYIFSNRLVNGEEMQNRFGGILFGSLTKKSLRNRKKAIGSMEEQLSHIATRLELYCKQNDITKIALIGSSFDQLNQNHLDKLTELLSKSDIEAIRLGNIDQNADALNAAAKIGKAVVVEGIGISVRREIEKVIMAANQFKVDLPGCIAV